MDKNDPRVDGEYNTHSLLNIIGMHLLICCLRINSTLLVGSAMKKPVLQIQRDCVSA